MIDQDKVFIRFAISTVVEAVNTHISIIVLVNFLKIIVSFSGLNTFIYGARGEVMEISYIIELNFIWQINTTTSNIINLK